MSENVFDIGDRVIYEKDSFEYEVYHMARPYYTLKREPKDGEEGAEVEGYIRIGGIKGGSLSLVKQTNNIKGEDKMNKNIVNVYEKTADAVLVQKWFDNGQEHSEASIDESFYDYLFLKDHKDEFLKEAKRLEAEAKNKD